MLSKNSGTANNLVATQSAAANSQAQEQKGKDAPTLHSPIVPPYIPAYNNEAVIFPPYAPLYNKDAAIVPPYLPASNKNAAAMPPQKSKIPYIIAIAAGVLLTALYIAAFWKIQDMFFEKGDEYMGNEDSSNAITEYTKALWLNPANADAYGRRGLCYYFEDNYDKAMSDFNKAILIDPNNALFPFWRGLVYANQNKADDAITDFTSAILLNSTWDTPYFYRGLVYSEKDFYQDAIDDYDLAISYDYYDTARIYNAIARCQFLMAQYDSAFTDINISLNSDPYSAMAHGLRGAIYRSLGRYDDALFDYDFAIQIDPNYAYAYMGRGITHYLKINQDNSDYRSDRERAASLDKDATAQAYVDTAISWYHQGNYADAVRFYNIALEFVPNDARIRRLRGEAQAMVK